MTTPVSASFNIPLSREQSTRLLTDKGAYVLLLWINDAQALDNLEI